MRRQLKRLASLALTFIFLLALLPSGVLAANTYVINGVSVRYDDFSSSAGQCWAYANNIYNKIWGVKFNYKFDDSTNLLRNKTDSELTLTAGHLQEYVSMAPIGSVIRICNIEYLHAADNSGHSQIIVSKDAGGFTVLEGGLTKSPHRREHYYTWAEYTDKNKWPGKYDYIKYIKNPNSSVSLSTSYINITDETAPSGDLPLGQSFILKGVISSSHTLTSVSATIVNLCTNRVVSGFNYSNNPGSSSYNIRTGGLDSSFKFANLTMGQYRYSVSATNSAGITRQLICADFSVGSPPNPVAPTAPRVYADSSQISISWDDVENETGYDYYVVRAPWGWDDIVAEGDAPANSTWVGILFGNDLPDGDYAAFVIARPNADTVQSAWTTFTIRTNSYLNVDAYVDGVLSDGFSGIGLIDVYVNGGQVAAGWGDYWDQHPVGASYEIRNIRPENGYSYDGIAEGSRVGTITDAEQTTVVLNFRTVSNNAPTATASGSLHGNTYYFVNREVTWFEAKKLCENMGGHLATIGSAEENAYVLGIVQNTQAWLGATDRANEGEWRWITGEPFNYTNWAGNQPDNCGGEQEEGESYLHFSWESGGQWNDNAGCALLPFVCEIDGEPVSITSQPKDAAVAVGSSATFAVAATGATSYQWYYRTSTSGSWTAVAASSGKTATYSLTAEARHNGYQYRCLVSNATNSVYTNTVTLTVNGKPVITTQPTSKTVTAGATAQFKVAATGAASYQWYYRTSTSGSWTAVAASSGKTSTYSLTAETRHNGYQYRCLVKNAVGSVYTNTVTLTVR